MNFRYIPTFDECMNMLKKDSFINKEEIVDNISITTFSYRLATINDFISYNGSINMRGITFRTDTKELIALPLHKFWNLNENEHTTSEIFASKKILHVSEKYDGSLIYFFILNNKLFCKTKMNSFSEQAVWAMNIVNKNIDLKNFIINQINNGYTPMFEFISPRNKIVVFYTNEQLKYICSRNMFNGEYDFNNYGLDSVDIYDITNIDKVLDITKDYSNHEGLVIVFDDYNMVKVKTEEYFNLHKIKENVYNENSLAELIVNEKIDDAKSIFKDDENILDYINEFEKQLILRYNFFKHEAINYYDNNKDLIRKDYAIKGKTKLGSVSFGLAMELFNNNQLDETKYKKSFISKKLWK